MKLKFLGAAKTVTGSFFLIDTGEFRFAVDCGLFQGPKEVQARNCEPFPVEAGSIDFLIITHAHIDHTGLIPKLFKAGFKGLIYCSHATEALADIMLPDSAHIQESEVERKNRKLKRMGQKVLEPIYTTQDAQDCLLRFRSLNTDEIIKLASGIEIRLRDAGHILGACIVEIWLEQDGKRIKLVFSGDLGTWDQPIVKNPTIIENADYVIMESTYGDRYHQDVSDRTIQLRHVIEDTMRKGGNLVIPAFAVERTQDLLFDLVRLRHAGQLDPGIDIYIDSPLAIAATEIFMKNIEFFDDETRTFVEECEDPLQLLNLKYSRTQEESMRLNTVKSNTIIISASGMCEAGRIKHHLKHNLWRPESTVLFVGYQAAGTLGRRILDGEKLVTIHGEKIAVKADIRRIEAYSAHADRNDLLKWVKGFATPPRQVILVHGEEEALESLAAAIRSEINVPVHVPDWLEEFELETNGVKVVQAAPAPDDKSAGAVDQALQAQKMFLETTGKLHKLFQEHWSRADYEAIIEKLKRLDADMN